MAKTCKYYKQQKYVSYDGGQTWQALNEYQKGDLYERDSQDCGAIVTIYRWNKIPVTTDPSTYACDNVNHNKHYVEHYQYSDDGGQTWADVIPVSSRTSADVYEYASVDCGYEPKGVILTYRNGGTYTKDCIDFSQNYVTTDDVRPSGYNPYILTRVVVGDCMTGVGAGCFNGGFNPNVPSIYSALTTVTLPATTVGIGASAFTNCDHLSSINSVSSGLATFPSGLTIIDDWAFVHCVALRSVTISNSLTTIGRGAFNACSGLTTVSIGGGITSIGDGAFYDCTNLQSITILATNPPTLGSDDNTTTYAFDNTNNCPIYVPSASVNAYKSGTPTAPYWSKYASRIQAFHT